VIHEQVDRYVGATVRQADGRRIRRLEISRKRREGEPALCLYLWRVDDHDRGEIARGHGDVMRLRDEVQEGDVRRRVTTVKAATGPRQGHPCGKTGRTMPSARGGRRLYGLPQRAEPI
jgi:hypothetical protein